MTNHPNRGRQAQTRRRAVLLLRDRASGEITRELTSAEAAAVVAELDRVASLEAAVRQARLPRFAVPR